MICTQLNQPVAFPELHERPHDDTLALDEALTQLAILGADRFILADGSPLPLDEADDLLACHSGRVRLVVGTQHAYVLASSGAVLCFGEILFGRVPEPALYAI